jgi:thioredoxin-related protein
MSMGRLLPKPPEPGCPHPGSFTGTALFQIGGNPAPPFGRFTVLLFSLASLLPAAAVDSSDAAPPWWTDYKQARAYAAEQGLPLLLLFHGSDWCTWCQKLEVELWDMPAFRNRLNRDLVAVSLDFPRRFRPPIGIERQNRKLKSEFAVEHFPTVLWVDPISRTILFRHAYLEASPEEYLEALSKWKGKDTG